MEHDPAAIELTRNLQQVTRQLLPLRFGPEPYFVQLDLVFPAKYTVRVCLPAVRLRITS